MVKYLIIIILILLSALFSGLTLGLMSLDVYDLKRKKDLGDIDAARVYEIRKKGNLLLSTLLLSNIAVTSTISIILESIAGGFVAVLSATGIIFIFGEVIPQAVIPRFALEFGSMTAPFTRALMFVLYPICGPVAYVLDKILGRELPTIYSKKELERIVTEHEDNPEAPIDADEERILHGALQYSDKKVEDIMTPIEVVVMVRENDPVDEALLLKMKSTGRSRMPVLDNNGALTGLLYTKDLIGVSFDGEKKIKDLARSKVLTTKGNEKLDNVLNRFLETRLHLFAVVDDKNNLRGIITIEDILEEILKREIVDESDKYTDMRQFAKTLRDRKKGR